MFTVCLKAAFMFAIVREWQQFFTVFAVRSKQMMGESRTTLKAFFSLAENWIDGLVEHGVSCRRLHATASTIGSRTKRQPLVFVLNYSCR
jgi:hypothetical protein